MTNRNASNSDNTENNRLDFMIVVPFSYMVFFSITIISQRKAFVNSFTDSLLFLYISQMKAFAFVQYHHILALSLY